MLCRARLSITFARKRLTDRKVCRCVSARFALGLRRDLATSARSGDPRDCRRDGRLTPHRQRGCQPAHEGRHAGFMPRTRTRTRSALSTRRPASIEGAAVYKACSLGEGSVSGGQRLCVALKINLLVRITGRCATGRRHSRQYSAARVKPSPGALHTATAEAQTLKHVPVGLNNPADNGRDVPKAEVAGSFDWLMTPARRGALALPRSREMPGSAKSP